MKLTILLLAATFTTVMTGCKAGATLSNAYSKVLNHADIEQPYREKSGLIVLEANVYELYDTADFKKKCPVAIVVLDAANGSINAKVKCNPDSISALKGVGKNLVELLLPRDYKK